MCVLKDCSGCCVEKWIIEEEEWKLRYVLGSHFSYPGGSAILVHFLFFLVLVSSLLASLPSFFLKSGPTP
jgi:hypothetical protein